MIKEVVFGTPIKMGKELTLGWNLVSKSKWTCKKEGAEFKFENPEWPTVCTTITNVRYWIEDEEQVDAKSKRKTL